MSKFYLYFVILISGGLIAFTACSESDNTVKNDDPDPNINSCEGCHTNYDALKELAEPDTTTGGGGHGCGGDAPHYEVYDQVYLGGDGYEEFKQTKHGQMECTACHNGVDNTDNKAEAHSGDFIASPSSRSEETCGTCHADVVANTKNSIHEQGWGQKRKVTVRYGLEGPHQFDQMPENLQHGYDQNCATCHATCAECHVMRPKAGGGGLADGHNFSKKPDMNDVCVTCHSSRGGHAYLGVAPGTKPDVHLTKLGFTCMNCHSKTDVHGDGKIHEQRYAIPGLPECSDCHGDVSGQNNYHAVHSETFSCYTCHSQPYNNCGSCHIGGEGARIPSYQDFKIAMNPIPDLKDYKLALVRRTLMAPDSWKEYGIDNLQNFSAFPTYNYTTPHNINKWTAVTEVADGKNCYENCHIIKDGDTLRNKQLYLFESDLLEWEVEANKNVVVDGKLPEGWEVE